MTEERSIKPEATAKEGVGTNPVSAAVPPTESKPIEPPNSEVKAALAGVDCLWTKEMPVENGRKAAFSFEDQPKTTCDIAPPPGSPADSVMPLQSESRGK